MESWVLRHILSVSNLKSLFTNKVCGWFVTKSKLSQYNSFPLREEVESNIKPYAWKLTLFNV